MTTKGTPTYRQLDEQLEQLWRERELIAAGAAPDRRGQIADLYDEEAVLWSAMFEKATDRLFWRAALVAEAHARMWAQWWRESDHSVHLVLINRSKGV